MYISKNIYIKIFIYLKIDTIYLIKFFIKFQFKKYNFKNI
jgi:hypothetical protein